MKILRFTLSGEPTTETRVKVYNGRGVNSDSVNDAQRTIFFETVKYRQRPLPEGPVFIRLDLYRSVPTWFTPAECEEAYAGEIYPTITPDNDNYEKLIFDALREVIYLDDSQITDNYTKQRYGRKPRTEVTVIYLDKKKTRPAKEKTAGCISKKKHKTMTKEEVLQWVRKHR